MQATKDSAKRFGQAVSMSAVIRSALGSVLPDDTDRRRMYLLNKKLYQWLGGSPAHQPGGDPALSVIRGFELNPATELPALLRPAIKVDWRAQGPVSLWLPAFIPSNDIRAPRGAENLSWRIGVVSCTVESPSRVRKSFTEIIDLPYDARRQEERMISFPVNLGPGELGVLVMALRFFVRNPAGPLEVTDPKWLPLGLVGGGYYYLAQSERR
jgi:hypothetical protein